MEQYILSIDAGTTSARCIIFDKQGNVRAMKQRELHMVYPHDGWVEQSAREIWEVQRTVCQEAIAALAIRPRADCRHWHHQSARDNHCLG